MRRKLCLHVCHQFKAIVAEVVQVEGWEDVEVRAFPAHCGTPALTWDSLTKSIPHPEHYNEIHIIGGACLTVLKTPPANFKQALFRILPQCFHLIAPPALVDDLTRQRAYLLTAQWLSNWRQHMKAWGFDEEMAPEFFKEFADELVLLDTGDDERDMANLEEFARFVDRDYRRLPVGLDFVRLFLTQIVLEWRLKYQKDKLMAQRQTANYAMALDLFGQMTGMITEQQAIDKIFDMFSMLFAADEIAFVPVRDGEIGEIRMCVSSKIHSQIFLQSIDQFNASRMWVELDNGFMLKLNHNDKEFGILVVNHLSFPEYKEHYLNLALALIGVCGLVLDNTHAYERIRVAEQQRLEALLERERTQILSQFITQASHEFKTPLSIISTGSYFLQRLAGEPGSKYADKITTQIQAITELVNDMTMMIRVNSQTLPEKVETDINGIVQGVLDKEREEVRDKRLNVIADLSSTPMKVGVIPIYISEALEQVYENAVQFTPEGGTIFVQVRRENPHVVIEVQDKGIGIAAEHLPHVFDHFYRVDQSGQTRGFGLGLTIARAIIQQHGGGIGLTDFEPAASHAILMAVVRRVSRRL